MKTLRYISKITIAVLTTSLSFSLIACDDSSSASDDDVLGSSDSGTALGSSGSVPAGMEGLPDDVLVTYSILPQCGDESMHPEGSCNSITGADGKVYQFECVGTQWEYNQDCEEPMCLTVVSQMQHPECQFPECNADSEGLVHVRVTGTPKYGQGYVFYRCEQGKWAERSAWVKCDTAGVTEGELCRVQTRSPGMMGNTGTYNCYKYAGNGTWNDVDCPTMPEKECTAENDGDVEKITYGNETGSYTEYYICIDSAWTLLDSSLFSPSSGPDSVVCNSLIGPDIPFICSDTLQIDGAYYRESGFMRREAAGCTYKCQDNKWSYVSAEDVPAEATVVTDKERLDGKERAVTMFFKKCNDENEGLYDISSDGNAKYGYSYTYYKCEQGNWVESPAWVACDTAGVAEGDTCKIATGQRGFQFGQDGTIDFIYAGNGVWEYADPSLDPKDTCSLPTRECTESNEFEIDSSLTSLKSSRTCYALCRDKTWETLDAYDVPVYAYCGKPNKDNGNHCCYTSPAEVVEDYPWNVSSLYEYEKGAGWRLQDTFDVPDCGATAE